MAIKTFDEYLASLRKLKPVVYMFGEKIENPIDHPRIRKGINATGATYELANSPFGLIFGRYLLTASSAMRMRISAFLTWGSVTCRSEMITSALADPPLSYEL